jgi:hypothetical protein
MIFFALSCLRKPTPQSPPTPPLLQDFCPQILPKNPKEGLEVHAWLDQREYQKSRKVTDEQLLSVRIQRNEFHGEWNYTILPDR